MWGRSNWARKGEGGGLGNRDTTFPTPLAGRLSPVASIGDPLPCPESQETWNLERSFFPNSLREPEKNVFLTVAYSHSPKSTSLRKSCVCAEGSSSRCLACILLLFRSQFLSSSTLLRGAGITLPASPQYLSVQSL